MLLTVAIPIAIAVNTFNPASLIRSQQLRNDAIIAEQMAASIGTLA
ncbi:hypothetical protein GCM10007052_07230 [Halioglobus japonicus]|nr:hypothetical protein [Halioglobus japonicus]GHD09257.1 hypothetical protein GCM10007052_07230 [Halioglobus japonicus]